MQDTSERRVAVIAIHGVGDSQPGDIVRGAGDLLASLHDQNGPRYCTFGQTRLRLSVSGVKVEEHASPTGHLSWGPLDEHFRRKTPVRPAYEDAPDSIDHLFMEGQLADFSADGPDAIYEALRLEGYRYDSGQANRRGASNRRVHLYDMTWSDLSGVGAKGARILGELYQILFHLGSIGVNNVRAAALSLPEIPMWRKFAWVQQFTASCLAWPIPLMNLLLMALGLSLFAVSALRGLAFRTEMITSTVLCAVALLGATGFALNRLPKVNWWIYALSITALLAGFVAVCFGVWSLPPYSSFRETAELADGAVLLAIFGFGALAMVKAYDTRRPSTKRVFFALTAVWFVLTVTAIAWTGIPAHFQAMYLILRGLDIGLFLLGLASCVFSVAMITSLVLGFAAVRKTPEPERSRAHRTNWTARLCLALPTSLFLLLTFAAWAGIVRLGAPLLPATAPDCSLGAAAACAMGEGLCYSPLSLPSTQLLTVPQVLDDIYLASGVAWLPVILAALLIAALFSLWAFFPSVLEEVSPTVGDAEELMGRSAANRAWLTDGFRLMRWGGEVLYLAVLLFFPFLCWVYWAAAHEAAGVRFFADISVTVSGILGLVVAGATAGLLGFSGRLSKLALGLRPIVSVALDVDNWMRENPRGTNPTTRISARFVSLLRYILQWRDDHGRGYDSLIVLSYSQGTVIATDILRFLHVEARHCGGYGNYDPSLARMDGLPRHLLTMGCPLKQLYGWRFPYLYGFAAGESPATRPHPDSMGLQNWVNAYRSSDYVGRDLWSEKPWQPTKAVDVTGSWSPSQGIPEPTYNQDGAVEYPIGVGAHTHYFDSTSQPIALILDDLIARA